MRAITSPKELSPCLPERGRRVLHIPPCLSPHLEPASKWSLFLTYVDFKKNLPLWIRMKTGMGRQICSSGKNHTLAARLESLARLTEKEFLPGPVGFSHLHKIHIYLQLSAWAWQMWPEIKIKINGLDRPWMLEACLAAWARLSYKIKRITEAFFQEPSLLSEKDSFPHLHLS